MMSVRRRRTSFKQWNPARGHTSARDFRPLQSRDGAASKRRQSGRSLPTALPALREWTLLSRKCQSTRRLAPLAQAPSSLWHPRRSGKPARRGSHSPTPLRHGACPPAVRVLRSPWTLVPKPDPPSRRSCRNRH